MKAIDPAGFEALFQVDADPWDYAGSRFEAFKRGVLRKACGLGVRGRVLELACANGETTKALRPIALRLLALDAAPAALEEARRRTRHLDRITVRRAVLPGAMPRGPFDLIVVSELLYYLTAEGLRRLLPRLRRALAPGGRLVVLHHVVDFADAAQVPMDAQARAWRALRSDPLAVHRRQGRFAVFAVRRASRPRRRGRG